MSFGDSGHDIVNINKKEVGGKWWWRLDPTKSIIIYRTSSEVKFVNFDIRVRNNSKER